MKKIIYVTGSRADYGLMSNTLSLLDASSKLDLSICVTGSHLRAESGMTVEDIYADGFTICDEIDPGLQRGTGSSMAEALSKELKGMARTFFIEQPDLVMILGDRGEMMAAALAALHLNIPIAHIHGGELSGTIDEPIRHAISKIANLHFVATEASRNRLIRMGENPGSVMVVGAPGLDGIGATPAMSKEEMCREFEFSSEKQIALMVYHPVVQEQEVAQESTSHLLSCLIESRIQTICILPNFDAGGQEMQEEINRISKTGWGNKLIRTVRHLSRSKFLACMQNCDFMIGNSSSGIIEAASFDTPVINIGSRQNMRERSDNVMDVCLDDGGFESAISEIIQAGKNTTTNIYGNGDAGDHMVAILEKLDFSKISTTKVNSY
jgi:GDP/UDP-N,N'-diacetylbacillosamine 2-epimerase (hydrolysing)